MMICTTIAPMSIKPLCYFPELGSTGIFCPDFIILSCVSSTVLCRWGLSITDYYPLPSLHHPGLAEAAGHTVLPPLRRAPQECQPGQVAPGEKCRLYQHVGIIAPLKLQKIPHTGDTDRCG